MICLLQTPVENILKWSMQKNNCYLDLVWLMCSNLNYFCHRLSILNSDDSYAKRSPTMLRIKEGKPYFELLLSSVPCLNFPRVRNRKQSDSLVWLVEETTQTVKGAGLFHSGLDHGAWPSLPDITSSLTFPCPGLRSHSDKMWPFCSEGMGDLLLSYSKF